VQAVNEYHSLLFAIGQCYRRRCIPRVMTHERTRSSACLISSHLPILLSSFSPIFIWPVHISNRSLELTKRPDQLSRSPCLIAAADLCRMHSWTRTGRSLVCNVGCTAQDEQPVIAKPGLAGTAHCVPLSFVATTFYVMSSTSTISEIVEGHFS
jgi:hypothetical protein